MERGTMVPADPFVWPRVERSKEFAPANLQAEPYLQREYNARRAVFSAMKIRRAGLKSGAGSGTRVSPENRCCNYPFAKIWILVGGDWLTAAGIRGGKIFRCVCLAGKTWGRLLRIEWSRTLRKSTERSSARLSRHHMTCAVLVLGYVALLAANWSTSGFCWVTFRSRRPRNTSAARRESETQSTVGSVSNHDEKQSIDGSIQSLSCTGTSRFRRAQCISHRC